MLEDHLGGEVQERCVSEFYLQSKSRTLCFEGIFKDMVKQKEKMSKMMLVWFTQVLTFWNIETAQ